MDSRILEHLSVLPISDEGEAKHFVHLTQVLDKIFELATLDDPEVDKKVLDVIKRVKSLPIMKISLNKLVSTESHRPCLSTIYIYQFYVEPYIACNSVSTVFITVMGQFKDLCRKW